MSCEAVQEPTQSTWLRAIHLAEEYSHVLEPNVDDTFRCKHIGESRGTLYQLRNAGLIRDSGSPWGRVTDWEVTELGADAVDAVVDDTEVPVLDEYTVDVVERHEELLRTLPPEDETFQAADFGLNASLLACLRRAGLIEREVERTGAPDTWSITETTVDVRAQLEGEQ